MSDKLLLCQEDKNQFFTTQWKTHREDQRLGLWTDMRLVGVKEDGTFSSVQVSQLLVLIVIVHILRFPGPPGRNPSSLWQSGQVGG